MDAVLLLRHSDSELETSATFWVLNTQQPFKPANDSEFVVAQDCKNTIHIKIGKNFNGTSMAHNAPLRGK
jgi:hypothetical protein